MRASWAPLGRLLGAPGGQNSMSQGCRKVNEVQDGPQGTPRDSQEGPRDSPEASPEAPKDPQEGPQRLPRGPQDAPRATQEVPKDSRTGYQDDIKITRFFRRLSWNSAARRPSRISRHSLELRPPPAADCSPNFFKESLRIPPPAARHEFREILQNCGRRPPRIASQLRDFINSSPHALKFF